MYSISQNAQKVNIAAPYQSNSDPAEILALADIALQQWRAARALWLATGDPLAWRRMQAAEADRAALLKEMEREGLT